MTRPTAAARNADGLIYIRPAEALTVKGWFETHGGVRYWRGQTPEEWWLTPLGTPDYPSPWALPDPEEIRDIARIAVTIPKTLARYPIRIARELPQGVFVTIHTERRLRADERRFTKQYPPPVWVELDAAAGTARWCTSGMILPLRDVKENMEFLR